MLAEMAQDNRQRSLRSGELARLAGVSTDTLRHYEKIGVLRPPTRTATGYRQYSPGSLGRVRLIRHALALGFSLSELARILRTRDQGGAPCREVRVLAGAKLREVERQLVEFRTLRDRLRSLVKDWDRRLARTPKGARAGLLELLDGPSKRLPKRKGVKP
jgi:MerR family transcriptional regulator, Zn(II)-responsive regulator of zntA